MTESDLPQYAWTSQVIASHPPRREIVVAIDGPGGDADLVLDYEDATYLRDNLVLLLGSELYNGTHLYLSTGCLHGDVLLPDGQTGHAYCQGETGAVGAKTPAVCKFCAAPCQCPCHSGDRCSTCGVLVEPYGMVLHHRAVHASAEQLAEDAPPCTWPACLPEAQQQQLADDVAAGMLGKPTGPRPDPRPGCGCVKPEAHPESRTWTVTTTVTAPTPEDAERWAGTLRDLQLAEHGDHMRLDIVVAPAAAPGNTPLPTPATSEADAECGFVRDRWDGPYRMRDRCTGQAGHAASWTSEGHGPWEMLADAPASVAGAAASKERL